MISDISDSYHSDIEQLKTKLQQVSEGRSHLEEKLESQRKKTKAAEADRDNLRADISGRIQSGIDELDSRLRQASEGQSRAEENFEYERKQARDAQTELDRVRMDKIGSLESDNARLTAKLEQAEKDQSQFQFSLDTACSERDGAITMVRELESRLSNNTNLAAAQSTISKLRDDLAGTKRWNHELLDEKTQLEKKVERLERMGGSHNDQLTPPEESDGEDGSAPDDEPEIDRFDQDSMLDESENGQSDDETASDHESDMDQSNHDSNIADREGESPVNIFDLFRRHRYDFGSEIDSGSEIDEDEPPEENVASPGEFDSSITTPELDEGAPTVAEPENELSQPLAIKKGKAKNPLARVKSDASPSLTKIRKQRSGISKGPKPENGLKHAHKAGKPVVSTPKARSLWIKEMTIEEDFITAYDAYFDGDHEKLGEDGQAGLLYQLPRAGILTLYSPHGADSVFQASINESDIWDPSKNWCLPAVNELKFLYEEDYKHACILATIPEAHLAADRSFEAAVMSKRPKLKGLAAKFALRFPYTQDEMCEAPLYTESLDKVFQKTVKELASLPAFQHAAISWADGASVESDRVCWPPHFSDPFMKQKTSDPKNWRRNEIELMTGLRRTLVDKPEDSLPDGVDLLSL